MTGCRPRDCKLESQLSHITSMEIDNEIISAVILPYSADTVIAVVSLCICLCLEDLKPVQEKVGEG